MRLCVGRWWFLLVFWKVRHAPSKTSIMSWSRSYFSTTQIIICESLARLCFGAFIRTAPYVSYPGRSIYCHYVVHQVYRGPLSLYIVPFLGTTSTEQLTRRQFKIATRHPSPRSQSVPSAISCFNSILHISGDKWCNLNILPWKKYIQCITKICPKQRNDYTTITLKQPMILYRTWNY